MSRRDGDTFVVEGERPQECDFCGTISALRPYGPNGEAICFDCGMRDEATTARVFAERVAGVRVVVLEEAPDAGE